MVSRLSRKRHAALACRALGLPRDCRYPANGGAGDGASGRIRLQSALVASTDGTRRLHGVNGSRPVRVRLPVRGRRRPLQMPDDGVGVNAALTQGLPKAGPAKPDERRASLSLLVGPLEGLLQGRAREVLKSKETAVAARLQVRVPDAVWLCIGRDCILEVEQQALHRGGVGSRHGGRRRRGGACSRQALVATSYRAGDPRASEVLCRRVATTGKAWWQVCWQPGKTVRSMQTDRWQKAHEASGSKAPSGEEAEAIA